jgi:hypothetical protein
MTSETAASVEVVGDIGQETIHGDTRQSSRNSRLAISAGRGGPGLSLGGSAEHIERSLIHLARLGRTR